MLTIRETDDAITADWFNDFVKHTKAVDPVDTGEHLYEVYKTSYENLINNMEIKEGWKSIADRTARRCITNKPIYQQVEAITNVPWQFIAVVHILEANGNFNGHLANGDSLNGRTYHVPAGRIPHLSPPYTFLQGAQDALAYEGLTQVTDWALPHAAYLLERYNGMAYHSKGINSPYLWSGTNNYSVGKYVADGVYDAGAVSQQLGAMALLSRIVALDLSPTQITASSTKLTGVTATQSAGAIVAGVFSLDKLNYFPTYISQYKALGLTSSEMLLVGAGVMTFILASLLVYRSQGDYAAGTYTPRNLTEVPVTGATKL